MLWSVPIVQVILVILFKKKKNKQKDPYFGMPQNPAIYLFLGKGRESFVSDFIQIQNLVRFLACPPAHKYFSSSGPVWMTHTKIHTKLTTKMTFSANFAPFQ